MSGMQLLDTTNELLDRAIKQGFSLAEIARLSGGTVDWEWLKKFSKRDPQTRDATARRVQSLYDTLVTITPRQKRRRA